MRGCVNHCAMVCSSQNFRTPKSQLNRHQSHLNYSNSNHWDGCAFGRVERVRTNAFVDEKAMNAIAIFSTNKIFTNNCDTMRTQFVPFNRSQRDRRWRITLIFRCVNRLWHFHLLGIDCYDYELAVNLPAVHFLVELNCVPKPIERHFHKV